MLKPTSAFVYVFQDASTSEEGACVALTVGVGEGDCVFCANELHDASTITTMRTMDCFLTLRLLVNCFWRKPPNGWRPVPAYFVGVPAGVDSAWEQEKPEASLSRRFRPGKNASRRCRTPRSGSPQRPVHFRDALLAGVFTCQNLTPKRVFIFCYGIGGKTWKESITDEYNFSNSENQSALGVQGSKKRIYRRSLSTMKTSRQGS